MLEKSMAGIIFSNMHDECLEGLTAGRTFASVPFGARYRLVDFTLSNMMNYGIDSVGIITKHNYRSLVEHIGSGKAWDLNRKNGGIRIISPYGRVEHGVYHDRLEALYGAQDFISSQSVRYIILSDCNTVSSISISQMLSEHIKNGADITIAYKKMCIMGEKRCKTSTITMDKDSRITGVSEFCGTAGEYNVDLNIWIIEKQLLEKIMDDGMSKGYKSLTRDVLKNSLDSLKVVGWEAGYAKKIMSVEDYYEANMELLTSWRDALFLSGRPVCTTEPDNPPTIYGEAASVENSLVADGCKIMGEVRNSIVFRNTVIEEGAKVSNCIVMDDCSVCSGATIKYSIVDKQVTVRGGRSLSGDAKYPFYIRKGRTV